VDILFNTPFNILLNKRIPIVEYIPPRLTGTFAAFLCIRSDFPDGRQQRGSKENDWQNPK
jgi:hypothetical protein